MVICEEYDVEKEKKKQLKKIVKRIYDLDDSKLTDLSQIVTQTNKAADRGLGKEKIKSMFLSDIDEFLEENQDIFGANLEQSITK